MNGIGGRPYQFDWNNFGLRFGFAWRSPNPGNMVLRGGYGIFFTHPFDNTETTAASLGFSLSANLNSPDGVTAPFVLRNGVPPVTPSPPALDDSFGAVGPSQVSTTAVTYFARDRVSGYSHQFNLTVQRQLSGLIVLDASFLGNLGPKLPSADLSINQIPPQILGPANHSQADRPFPQFSDVTLLSPSFASESRIITQDCSRLKSVSPVVGICRAAILDRNSSRTQTTPPTLPRGLWDKTADRIRTITIAELTTDPRRATSSTG